AISTRAICSANRYRRPPSVTCWACRSAEAERKRRPAGRLSYSIDSVFQSRTLVADGNALGLGLFRDNTLQIDMEQPVDQIGALDLDMVGQAEGQLERALGDALMQVADALGAAITLVADNGQHAPFDLQLQIVFLEAGSRDHDAVMVLAVLLDVVGGIGTGGVIAAQGRFEKIVETVETDGLAEQRSQGQYVAHEYSPEISARVI